VPESVSIELACELAAEDGSLDPPPPPPDEGLDDESLGDELGALLSVENSPVVKVVRVSVPPEPVV